MDTIEDGAVVSVYSFAKNHTEFVYDGKKCEKSTLNGPLTPYFEWLKSSIHKGECKVHNNVGSLWAVQYGDYVESLCALESLPLFVYVKEGAHSTSMTFETFIPEKPSLSYFQLPNACKELL